MRSEVFHAGTVMQRAFECVYFPTCCLDGFGTIQRSRLIVSFLVFFIGKAELANALVTSDPIVGIAKQAGDLLESSRNVKVGIESGAHRL